MIIRMYRITQETLEIKENSMQRDLLLTSQVYLNKYA